MARVVKTEAKETLDAFAEAMLAIVREAAESPELLHEAPHERPVRRLDEVRAAKQPVLRYAFGDVTNEGLPESVQARFNDEREIA